jgi:hypothetical protein
MTTDFRVKYPLFLSDFNVLWIFSTDFFLNYANIKFHQNPSSGSRVVLCWQTGGKRHMTKLKVALRYFAKAPKNCCNKQSSHLAGLKKIQQMSATTPQFLKIVHCYTCFYVAPPNNLFHLYFFVQSNPYTGLDRPRVYLHVEALRYSGNRHVKVLGLSASSTGHLFSLGNIPSTHFFYSLSRSQGHGAAGKKSNPRHSTLWPSASTKRTNAWPHCCMLQHSECTSYIPVTLLYSWWILLLCGW